MLEQLSVFTENKKGAMQNLLQILAREDINILGSVTNDSAEYGIVRMIVSDPDRAYQALKGEGYLCRKSNVLAVEVEDAPGSLNGLLGAISDMNVNVDYIYLSGGGQRSGPVIILHTESQTEVEKAQAQHGFQVLG